MSKALALVVVLFFVGFFGECYGELRVGFYKGKCGITDVEVVVKKVVETWHFTKREKDIAAALLRMQFHDCFVKVRNLYIYIAVMDTEFFNHKYTGESLYSLLFSCHFM